MNRTLRDIILGTAMLGAAAIMPTPAHSQQMGDPARTNPEHILNGVIHYMHGETPVQFTRLDREVHLPTDGVIRVYWDHAHNGRIDEKWVETHATNRPDTVSFHQSGARDWAYTAVNLASLYHVAGGQGTVNVPVIFQHNYKDEPLLDQPVTFTLIPGLRFSEEATCPPSENCETPEDLRAQFQQMQEQLNRIEERTGTTQLTSEKDTKEPFAYTSTWRLALGGDVLGEWQEVTMNQGKANSESHAFGVGMSATRRTPDGRGILAHVAGQIFPARFSDFQQENRESGERSVYSLSGDVWSPAIIRESNYRENPGEPGYGIAFIGNLDEIRRETEGVMRPDTHQQTRAFGILGTYRSRGLGVGAGIAQLATTDKQVVTDGHRDTARQIGTFTEQAIQNWTGETHMLHGLGAALGLRFVDDRWNTGAHVYVSKEKDTYTVADGSVRMFTVRNAPVSMHAQYMRDGLERPKASQEVTNHRLSVGVRIGNK